MRTTHGLDERIKSMNRHTYVIFWTLFIAYAVLGVWALVKYQPPPVLCIQGMVMVLHKNKQMYVHQGLWPTHCVPISTD